MNGYQHITIDLPESEVSFVRTFAARNKISVSDVFNRLVRTLQRASVSKIDPMIQSWAGILPPGTDVDALRLEYLTEKYLRDDRHD